MGCLLLGGETGLRAQEPGPEPIPAPSQVQAFPPNQGLDIQSIFAEPSPQLFTVLAAINLVGFDTGMEQPELSPLRAAVREELARREIPVLADLQEFYRSHEMRDPDQNLSQYISLALFLTPPPELALAAQNPVNMPLEVWDLRGMAPLLAAFYREADIAGLWQKYFPAMEQEAEGYRRLLAQVILETNAYLRIATPSTTQRGFAIYVSPLGAPNQTNARSYGNDYYLVVGPSSESAAADIQHGWLHYLLDPFPYRHAQVVNSKFDLHQITQRLPGLDAAFRGNFSLLLTESLIQAIQARRSPGDAQAKRQLAHEAVAEGFYLADYFFEAMEVFEQQPAGMDEYYSEMVDGISVRDEENRLADVQFRAQSTRLREAAWNSLEEMTLRGDASIAQGEYEQALQIFDAALEQFGPQPRVLYGLAIVATQQQQPERAKEYFTQAASLATDARTKAWSHIYLGRLLDLEGNRPEALEAYQAALATGDSSPDTREAAEKGIREGFASPVSRPAPEEKPRQGVPLGVRP